MKGLKAVCALLMIIGAAVPTAAYSRVFFGFNFGIPLYPPAYYYPPPVYYSPAPVVIEQTQPQPSAQPENWWYYCPDSKTYYPYVRECRSVWQRVPPTPPGS